VTYDLDGRLQWTIIADVGIDDESATMASWCFQVFFLDDAKFTTAAKRGSEPPGQT